MKGETQVRSIPEKTIEHWASIYATYRYRSFANLWWPTHGEDIAVGGLRTRGAGKIFNLEIKTTEARPSGREHLAEVRVSQLLKYLSKPVPTYYVFPVPDWHGPIHLPAAAAWLGAGPKTDLGFTRAGWRWFGEWTIVIPDYVLYAPLAATYPLTATVASNVSEPVFTATVGGAGGATRIVTMEGHYTGWTPPFTAIPAGGPLTPFYGWRAFWEDMDVCGGAGGLQSVFAVPRGGEHTKLTRSELRDRLATAAADQGPDQPLDFFVPAVRTAEPDIDREYARSAADTIAIGDSNGEDAEESNTHLTTVFVAAARIAAARMAHP